jgi:hypothetical protein
MRESPVGTDDNSPTFQRWVLRHRPSPKPRRGEREQARRRCSFVPTGTGLVSRPCSPALKGWAILFRPAGWAGRAEGNFFLIFDLCTTYRHHGTSLTRVRSPAQVAAATYWRERTRLRQGPFFMEAAVAKEADGAVRLGAEGQ